ncbi:MAG: glycosyl transferase family 2 [Bacteroidetes bacterium]|nr:glycosyl transferase family 2 [Bacteroidota bacterium]
MSVSVVILNWNGEKYLSEFLPVLQNNLDNVPDAEIIVADNGSTDGSLKLLAERFPSVKVNAFDKNYGFAEGYNKALKNIESDYYVLLNSDVEVSKGWLSVLYEYMEKNPEVAACQPKILSYNRRNYFEYAGAAGGFIDKFGYPYCRGRIFGEVEEDLGQYDDIKDVFWASGACMFIRSVDYWEAGGLDADFFAHMEEIDLCWRLKSRGKRIVCIPQSVVYHIGGGTLSAENPRKTYLNFRNNLLMLYKNLPGKSLKRVFDIRFYLDNLAALHLLLQGKYQNAKAVTDARTDFRTIQPQFSEKRNENTLKSVNSLQHEISQHSLIYEFYIKRHKKFSEISPNVEITEMKDILLQKKDE